MEVAKNPILYCRNPENVTQKALINYNIDTDSFFTYVQICPISGIENYAQYNSHYKAHNTTRLVQACFKQLIINGKKCQFPGCVST